jgi:hypothetical protein
MGLLRILTWPLRPFWRGFLGWMSAGDPWQRLGFQPPVARYGLGSTREFAWYFERQSAVEVNSLEDVMSWLVTCEYVTDPALFRSEDHWQHPAEFERIRRGDCEDHAIWAWRKLVELGYDADLVCGRTLPTDPSNPDERGHVWVIVRRDDSVMLLETVDKRRDAMLVTLTDAASRYRPEFGVDRSLKRYTFNGALITRHERA